MIKKSIAFSMVVLFLLVSCTRNITTSSLIQPTDTTTQSSPTPTFTPTPTPEVRVLNGESLLITGDYDQAYNEFLTSSTQSSDPELVASALLGMGKALLLKEDYYGVINHYSPFLINYTTGEARNTAFFFLAKAYDAIKQYRLAADAYANYLSALPGPLDSEIQEMRGNSLSNFGDFAGAISAYETALITASGSRYDQLQIKLAQAATSAGDIDRAINIYFGLLETSQSGYTKAQADLLLGRIYLQMGLIDQAYARFQDSVNNYTDPYDSYSALVQLVEDGQPVNQLNRGIINFNVKQYGIAIEALTNYLNENPNHDAEAHSYKALSFWELKQYDNEIAEWDKVILDHSSEQNYYFDAFNEKSNTQWLSLNQYLEAAQTCLTYVASVPTSTNAPKMLDKAARIYVDGGYLSLAAETYERILNEYPGSEQAYNGLFKAGILYYRLGEYAKAQTTFLRLVVLTDNPQEQAADYFWLAKSLEKLNDTAAAKEYYQKAATTNPTGYYGIRAAEILAGQAPLLQLQNIDLAVDYKNEKIKANRWVVDTFKLDATVDVNSPSELANNQSWMKAEVYTKLGMREQASSEFELLRNSLIGDAPNTYRLMNRTLELGYYRTAILCSRHVLDLAGLSQAATLTEPPIYFNHIRFGSYFRDYVIPTALEHQVDPMLIFSLIRQESLFDSSITSVASAKGLMQITPNTAVGIVENYGWPPDYTVDDLNRAMVNIRLGTHYLKRGLDLYDGDVYAALASYNAGDTATTRWKELSGGDQDLFLEIISYSETKNYIKSIVENHKIYDNLYKR
jgi:soluble lytic murein transglycosylase